MDQSFTSQYSASSDITEADDPGYIGTLIIVVMKAKNLYNRRAISKQNPFCTVRVANHSAKTEAIVRGGQAPTWDHEVRFKLMSDQNNTVLKLAVFDQAGGTADIIGETRVNLQPAFESSVDQGYDSWHPIHFNRRYMGEVYLEMTYYPKKRSTSKRTSMVSILGQTTANASRESLALSADTSRQKIKDVRSPNTVSRPSSQPPSRPPSRPLPQVPGENSPEPPSMYSILSETQLPELPQLPSDDLMAPVPPIPPLHNSTSTSANTSTNSYHNSSGQDDISRRINDRFGASMFERILPR